MTRALRRITTSALAALLAVFAVASCDSPTEIRYGALTLDLTDAPGDVVAAVVTIEQIYLQPGEDEDAQRFVILDEPMTVDLLTLVDTTERLVEGVEVPVGAYGQLRFVISGAYIEVEAAGGATEIYATTPDYAGLPTGAEVAGVLIAPSYAQTGLKVTLPEGAIIINEDQTATLIIDFDVAASFGQQAGGSGNWVLTPVVNGTTPEEPAP